jgi:hypothetical protein
VEDEVVQRGRQRPQTVEILAGFDENVFGETETPQAAMRPSHALDRRLVAFGHDHEKVQIAAFIGDSPGMGTKKPDAVRMEFVGQTMSDFVEQVLVNGSHGAQDNMTRLVMGRKQWLDSSAKLGVPPMDRQSGRLRTDDMD